jgi:hypothetical protein
MYHSPLPLIGWGATLLVCALAWWRGDKAERYGSLIIVVAGLAVFLSHSSLPAPAASLSLLIVDAGMAAGFLLLAIRYASLWLGSAMLLQAGQFSLHAFYLVGGLEHDRFYAVANNLITVGILVCILVGTGISWRRRSRTGSQTA